MSMHGVPVDHVAVDLDCDGLGIPADRKRRDYVFFGKEQNVAWVSPIELKGGTLRGGSVAAQLQGGADIADAWIPDGLRFRLVPCLSSGQRVHRERLRALRGTPITLRGQSIRPVLIRCGSRLVDALERGMASE